VTNITFIFETSPNTKRKEKKVGGTWHIMPPSLKKWGDTYPVSPTKLRPCVHHCAAFIRLINFFLFSVSCLHQNLMLEYLHFFVTAESLYDDEWVML